MPTLVSSDKCCGCAACANKCAKGAITMQPNEEGFLHPVIDTSLCVDCGLCEKACSGLEPAKVKDNTPQAYIVQHKDDAIRYQSTSGGAFTAIAEDVIRRGGVVFGAIMTEELKVKHDCVATIEDLAKFRNSKYVQSEIGDCYKRAKKLLTEGQMVCFSGTPCQINGLYKFLGKDYENLIAVDVVCKSVPSPMIFEKYVAFKKQQEGQISDVVFRDKKRGFLYCTMAHYGSHDARQKACDQYRRGSESDEWLRLFLSGKISRRSCMTCPYQTTERVGDFTLGDIWETGNTQLDDNKGSTLVHVWTKKGQDFLNKIQESVRCSEYPIEKSRGAERSRSASIELKPNRDQLFKDARAMTAEAFFHKYAPYSFKIRIKNLSRYWLWKLNLQNIVRGIKHTIIHRGK